MKSPARQRPFRLQPNLTSLIDVVFLLLVFFLLATQLVQEARVEMTLPAIEERQSGELPHDARVIVNVVPPGLVAETGGAYRVDNEVFSGDADGVAGLSRVLRQARDKNPKLRVLLRAARDEHYERVHPAMQAVTLAGVNGVDLVTVPPGDELERALRSASSGEASR